MAIMGNSDIYEICLAKAELSMWMFLFVVLQKKQNKRLFLGVIFIFPPLFGQVSSPACTWGGADTVRVISQNKTPYEPSPCDCKMGVNWEMGLIAGVY